MKVPLREPTSISILLLDRIKKIVRNFFNRDVFGIYEGVVERVDSVNGRTDIRIPELDELVLTDVRIMMPFVSGTGSIQSPITVGSHVIVGFRSFKLKNPIVLGQVADENTSQLIYPSQIRLTNGSGTIIITSSGDVIIEGNTITANGEDLTEDDRGVL